MSEKKKLSKRLLALCMIAVLVLPVTALAYSATEKSVNISLSGSLIDENTYRVSCETSLNNIPPTADITYTWQYRRATDTKIQTATTSKNYLDFAASSINGSSFCMCKATASYTSSLSLISDAYLRFLHRKTDNVGYDTWKRCLLDHSINNYAGQVTNIVGGDVSSIPSEICGVVYSMVFSDEYMGKWNPDPNGSYVRENPVPFSKDGVQTKNTPKQLIYDCYLYLLGKEPSEAEIDMYLGYYKANQSKTGTAVLFGNTYTYNQGMTTVICEIARTEDCERYLVNTYNKYDTVSNRFTYTVDDITEKAADISSTMDVFDFPARYTVNHHLQTVDCKDYEVRATDTFYDASGTKLTCEDFAEEFVGWHFDHAESGGTSVDNVTVMANNSTVIDLYYMRDEQIVDYTVGHYQKEPNSYIYKLVETETRSGVLGSKVTLKDLQKTYEGFTYYRGSKTSGGREEDYAPYAYATNLYSTAVIEEDTTNIMLFYNRNKYSVALEAKEGVKSTTGAGSYYYGETVTVDAQMVPGYSFSRWADAGQTINGTTKSFYNKALSFTMPANDVALNAYGRKNQAYLLTVDPNGGEWDGSEDLASVSMTAETTMQIEDPVLEGYIFNGWTIRYGEGSSLTGKDFTIGFADAYLIAKWSPDSNTKYRVNHYKETLEGDYILAETESKTGTTDAVVIPEVKEYEGFTAPKPKMMMVSGAGDSVMRYYYTRNSYTVRFDGNGAEHGEMEDVTLKYGETGKLEAGSFIHFGYEFEGWNTSPDGSGDFYVDEAQIINLSTEKDGEVVLYAMWYDLPFISAPDRYFSLREAQDGVITEEALMEKATIDGPASGMYVVDYDADFWKAQTEETQVLVTYAATDSKGRTISAKATVHLANTAPVYEEHTPYTRFISPKYWRDENGDLVDPEDGGVEWWSVWRNNPEYRDTMDFTMALEDTIKWGTVSMKFYGKEYMFQTEEMVDCAQIQYSYYFTHEDVLKVKEYVAQHGVGNFKEPHALRNFMDLFDYCRRREEEYMYDPEKYGPLPLLEKVKAREAEKAKAEKEE